MAQYLSYNGARVPRIAYNGSTYRKCYYGGKGYTLSSYTSMKSTVSATYQIYSGYHENSTSSGRYNESKVYGSSFTTTNTTIVKNSSKSASNSRSSYEILSSVTRNSSTFSVQKIMRTSTYRNSCYTYVISAVGIVDGYGNASVIIPASLSYTISTNTTKSSRVTNYSGTTWYYSSGKINGGAGTCYTTAGTLTYASSVNKYSGSNSISNNHNLIYHTTLLYSARHTSASLYVHTVTYSTSSTTFNCGGAQRAGTFSTTHTNVNTFQTYSTSTVTSSKTWGIITRTYHTNSNLSSKSIRTSTYTY